jgi:antitoxin HigA-1
MHSGLDPIHPGEFLNEILTALGVSQAAFAHTIGVSPMRVSHVVNGSRPVTADLALRFAKALKQTPQYWLNLQTAHDLAIASKTIGKQLKTIKAVA